MRAEKVILSFLAVLVGLAVAGVGFYIYQTTRTVSPSTIKTITVGKATPTPASSVFLSVETPSDESVVTSKVITISGKTDPAATLMVSTDATDSVVTPSATGAFSLTVTLTGSENVITITAIDPKGNETQKKLTVAYETENF